LVSDHSGIVVNFASASRDATEPPLPLVWRAKLSNHCFLSKVEGSHSACSGKGMTRTAAWTSCLGEAVERYSGGCWDLEEVVLRRRRDLDGRSVDPAELVIVPENALYFAALGAAFYGSEEEANVGVYAGAEALRTYAREGRSAMRATSGAPGLVASPAEVEEFRSRYSLSYERRGVSRARAR